MSIRNNLRSLQKEIPPHVRLVVVSKTKAVAEIMEVYKEGHKVFGENKAQEVDSKRNLLPDDIQWHFIGHLQTNKVKLISPYIYCIHSIDSRKLLAEVNREAKKHNRLIRCLLQLYIATEETKFGLSPEEAGEILDSEEYRQMQNIRIEGVMGMATFSCDQEVVRKEFRQLRNYFDDLKKLYFRESPDFREISMGMSSDYLIGIEEGSTMVRIGTAVFGKRNYP
jgi:PLP dependent protein